MSSAMPLDHPLVTKSEKVETGDLVFYGLMMMAGHLVFLFLNRFLVYNAILPNVHSAFAPSYRFSFYVDAVAAMLSELMFFVLGWLFIIGMAALFDGDGKARALFGGLGLSYAPVILSGLTTSLILLLNSSKINTSSVATATNVEELGAAVEKSYAHPVFGYADTVEKIGYTLMILLVMEAVSRIYKLSRLKAVIIVGAYVGVLFGLNYLTGG